jgi:phosphoserine aminotransferase
MVGRSHRAKPAKARIKQVIDKTRQILGVPADYRIAIVPASDTGAVEMMLWSVLGARPVDMLAWESFGEGWVTDVVKQLKLKDARVIKSDYGKLPNLKEVNFDNDVVFTWNGTTSGVRVPNGDWIPADRKGLTICDATSAVFAMDMPWSKLDVVTYSWQKVLGGEAQHGMLIISPRAVERLESYTPPWPMPKIFRLTSKGKLSEGIFEGDTINTVSMLCVEDAVDGLNWAESVGSLKGLIARSEANLKAISDWVAKNPWIAFLAEDSASRSCTSICLRITAPWFTSLPADKQAEAAKKLAGLLEKEGVAMDVASYRDAPPGLRIWGGATVDTADIQALLPWIEWAHAEVQSA